MADGHLGKCKECTKKDVQERYNDPEARKRIQAYERKRFQDPKRKEMVREYRRKMRQSDPDKRYVRQTTAAHIRDGRLKRKPCEVCAEPNAQAHHITYERENPFNIKWLCFKHHREEHGQKVG